MIFLSSLEVQTSAIRNSVTIYILVGDHFTVYEISSNEQKYSHHPNMSTYNDLFL